MAKEIKLAKPLVITAAKPAEDQKTSDSVVIMQNIDEPNKGALRTLVKVGDGDSSLHWVYVYGDEKGAGKYKDTWTDADVEAAIKAHFAALA